MNSQMFDHYVIVLFPGSLCQEGGEPGNRATGYTQLIRAAFLALYNRATSIH